jgi:hypothetical protein
MKQETKVKPLLNFALICIKVTVTINNESIANEDLLPVEISIAFPMGFCLVFILF